LDVEKWGEVLTTLGGRGAAASERLEVATVVWLSGAAGLEMETVEELLLVETAEVLLVETAEVFLVRTAAGLEAWTAGKLEVVTAAELEMMTAGELEVLAAGELAVVTAAELEVVSTGELEVGTAGGAGDGDGGGWGRGRRWGCMWGRRGMWRQRWQGRTWDGDGEVTTARGCGRWRQRGGQDCNGGMAGYRGGGEVGERLQLRGG